MQLEFSCYVYKKCVYLEKANILKAGSFSGQLQISLLSVCGSILFPHKRKGDEVFFGRKKKIPNSNLSFH